MNQSRQGQMRGQTLIEFAIILPVLLFILIVIFDLGRAVYSYTMLTNAAREGARFGSAENVSAAVIEQHTIDYGIGLGLQDPNVTVDKNNITTVVVGSSVPPRDDVNVVVTIDYDFVPITPYVNRLLNGGVIKLKTTARMGREY